MLKDQLFEAFKSFSLFLNGTGLLRLPYASQIYNWLYESTRVKKGLVIREFYGVRMRFNAADQGIAPDLLMGKPYEEFEVCLFQQNLLPSTLIIDIGANFGYYSLIAAKAEDPTSYIIAFEPVPKLLELLKENIRLNHFSNITVIAKAVSSREGSATIYMDDQNLGNPSLSSKNVRQFSGKHTIATVSLNNYLRGKATGYQHILIKMDVQGAEGLIIEGGHKIFKDSRTVVFMEFWPFGLTNNGSDPVKILKSLKQYGLKIRVIDEQAEKLLNLSNEAIVNNCLTRKDGRGAVNLYLTH